MQARTQISALFLLALVFAPDRVFACPCQYPATPCEAFGNASAVFIGRLSDDVRQHGNDASFEIIRSFSGVTGRTIHLQSGFGCQYSFHKGEQYLIYARRGEDQKLYVDECSRTALLSEAGEDLAFLLNLPKEGAGGRLFGEVGETADWTRRHDRGAESIGGRISEITVRVRHRARSWELMTDSEGKYELAGLSPGDYEVEVAPPDGYTGVNLKQEFSIKDRACRYAPFVLRPDGRMAGRISSADGRSAKVEVFVLPAEWKSRSGSERVGIGEAPSVATDEDGRYEIGSLRPGQYLLAVNVNGPSADSLQRRTFYPGVASLQEAIPIVLGLGQKIRIDLQLGRELKLYRIEGSVVWPDGRPVPGFGIFLLDRNGEQIGGGGMIRTDSQGRFSLKAIEGEPYRLSTALLSVSSAGKESSGILRGELPIDTLSGDLSGLLVVLRPCVNCKSVGAVPQN